MRSFARESTIKFCNVLPLKLKLTNIPEDALKDLKFLTSAYSQALIEGSMRAPQICGFIRKPFELGQLLKMLRGS